MAQEVLNINQLKVGVEDKEILNTYISVDENYEKVFDDETLSKYMKK